MAQEIFPVISMPLFGHARTLYAIENAAGLYPPSCFYASMVLIELLLNATNGGFMFGYVYMSCSLGVFFDPVRPWASWAGYVAFGMLMNVVTNVRTPMDSA